MRMMFIPVVDQKCAHMFVVHHTHPSKMNLLACNNIYGCHLYTLDLLLAQSYIPLLLHKYGFIFCYFNYLLHLHKILVLVGILECLCEFQQLAVVLKMFRQHKRGLINIYLYFQDIIIVAWLVLQQLHLFTRYCWLYALSIYKNKERSINLFFKLD